MTRKTTRYVSIFLAASLLAALLYGLAPARYQGSQGVSDHEFDVVGLQDGGIGLSGVFRMREIWRDARSWLYDGSGRQVQTTFWLSRRPPCWPLSGDSRPCLLRCAPSLIGCTEGPGRLVAVRRALSFQ